VCAHVGREPAPGGYLRGKRGRAVPRDLGSARVRAVELVNPRANGSVPQCPTPGDGNKGSPSAEHGRSDDDQHDRA